jgi:hypothetical protein
MNIVRMRHNQKLAISNHEEIVHTYSIETLLATHERWNALPPVLKNRDPVAYPLFNIALERAVYYLNSLKRNGTRWIEIRFTFLFCGALRECIGLYFNGMNMKKLLIG